MNQTRLLRKPRFFYTVLNRRHRRRRAAPDGRSGAPGFAEQYDGGCAAAGLPGKRAAVRIEAWLGVREQTFFTEHGFEDQHAGTQAFAHEADVMGWLFGKHDLN